jgi:hypothetical protein
MMRIARAGAITGLMAHIIVSKFGDHLPSILAEGVSLGDLDAVGVGWQLHLTSLLEQAATRRDPVPLSCMRTTRRPGVGLWSQQDQDRRPAHLCSR